MKIAEDSLIQYEFTKEELDTLKAALDSPLIQAYLRSSFTQLREAMLQTVQVPLGQDVPGDNAHLVLTFIAGAQELLSQITRITE